MAKKQSIGFGFIPEEAQQHFLVVTHSSNQNKPVYVYERFVWDDGDNQISEMGFEEVVRLKVILNREKWDLVKDALEAEFNRILKAENKKVGRFKTGQTPVERLLGKEMMVLLWAIEDCNPTLIPIAIKNWLGLSREERWWLFTMTNAITGNADDKRGWRIALRYAITENFRPDQPNQYDMFASLAQRVD